jgi:hypothetical protein
MNDKEIKWVTHYTVVEGGIKWEVVDEPWKRMVSA